LKTKTNNWFDGIGAADNPSCMQEDEYAQKQYGPEGRPVEPTFWQKTKKFLAPVGVAFVVFFKFLGQFKFLLPVLKTGLTMLVSIGAYAMF